METLNDQLTATRDLVRDFAAVREPVAVMVSPMTEGETDQVRRAADALARHAADERFERLAAPVRRQLNATERDRLPDFAAEWEAALRPRFRVLSDELEQIERHRTAIVERLQGMVLRALGRLRAAQRASRLPADLADWSGLEFLRISFTQPEEAVLAERLGQVLNEVTAAVPGKTAVKRDGMSILLSGVKAALQPRGVRVEVLKPDGCSAMSGSGSARSAMSSPAGSCSPQRSSCIARWPGYGRVSAGMPSASTPECCSWTTRSAGPQPGTCSNSNSQWLASSAFSSSTRRACSTRTR